MDLFPKYIIEDIKDLGICLIISKCTYHNELATQTKKVKGGGWFVIKNDSMIFRGDSYDFGKAKVEDVKTAIELNNVYTNKYLTHSIGSKYKFFYDNECELIQLN